MIRRTPCTVPALSGPPVLRNYLEFARDPIATLARAAREHGPMSLLHLAHERLVLVNEPTLIRHVLIDRPEAYSRTRNLEAPWLRLFMGDGLLTADGDLWRRLRRASMPAFTKAGVARMMERVERAAASVLDGWETHVARGEPRDLYPELVALTGAVTYQAFFGLDLGRDEALRLARALAAGQEFVVGQIRLPSGLLAKVPTPKNRALRRHNEVIARLVARALEDRTARKASGEAEADDMLGMLLASSRGAGPERLEAHELRDQLLTNLIAAPENTATAMTWALYLLGRHPDVAHGVQTEIDEGAGESLQLQRVIAETLRLYPGTPYFDRRAVADDEVGGHVIPKGTLVMIVPYVLHRTERYWERPHVFDPSRFTSPGRVDNPAYIPFGLGPRRCIGEHFALRVVQTVLPMMLRRFAFERSRSDEIETAPQVTLRPKGGFVVRVKGRHAGRVRVGPNDGDDPAWRSTSL